MICSPNFLGGKERRENATLCLSMVGEIDNVRMICSAMLKRRREKLASGEKSSLYNSSFIDKMPKRADKIFKHAE